MAVVLCVAAEALHRLDHILLHGLSMAGLAAHFLVRSLEGKPRLRNVVEAPEPPAIRCVTGIAARPQASLMMIIESMTSQASGFCVLVGRFEVALLARDHGVESEEGKARKVVVEEHIGTPPAFVVALRTLRTLLSPMNVAAPVAGHTGGIGLLIERAGMTALAGGRSMHSPQRKVRAPVMVEFGGRPRGRCVTGVALGAVATAMAVVRSVTRVAFGLEGLFVERSGVAGNASCVGVGPVEGETCVSSVVEGHAAPALGGVTGLAARTEPPPVLIANAVTAVAVRSGVRVLLARVTDVARHVLMPSQQRKRGLVVVEVRVLPSEIDVAAGAVTTESALVGVVSTVAGCAIDGRLPVFDNGNMTFAAGCIAVGTAQREIGEFVIEGLGFEA